LGYSIPFSWEKVAGRREDGFFILKKRSREQSRMNCDSLMRFNTHIHAFVSNNNIIFIKKKQ